MKKAITAVCGVALGLGLLTGCANDAANHVSNAVDAQVRSSAKLGSDEFYRITATIVNNSQHDLTLTTASAAYDNGTHGGNWNDRPAQTLAPAASTKAEVYSAAFGQALDVVYHSVQEPSARAKMIAQDPTVGDNNTNDTSSVSPLAVSGKITNGRQCTVTFTITGNLPA